MTLPPAPWNSGRIGIPDAVFRVAAGILVAITPIHESVGQSPKLWPPLTVAFIADQGLGDNARAVLRLIAEEGADLVLHQGDLDYHNDPNAWDEFITNILGADFPYFASIGNNDTKRWYGANGYQSKLEARLHRIPEASCTGDFGVKSACTFRGLFFILSGIGTEPDEPNNADHVTYIRNQLTQSKERWKICSWHKNQNLLQAGDHADEIGWAAYEICREQGSIIATAHTHNYSRTYLMDNFQKQHVISRSKIMTIDKGESFAFVSDLGGEADQQQRPWWSHIWLLLRDLKSILWRRKEQTSRTSGANENPWWASIYPDRPRTTEAGALFCTFFVNGAPDRADCYFKDIDGTVADDFRLINVAERVSFE